mgnify:CR=1 FL=1
MILKRVFALKPSFSFVDNCCFCVDNFKNNVDNPKNIVDSKTDLS